MRAGFQGVDMVRGWFAVSALSAGAAVLLAGCSSEFELCGPDEPKEWEKTAVAELDHYLGLCSENREVKIGWRAAVFHVGDTAFARAKGLVPRFPCGRGMVYQVVRA